MQSIANQIIDYWLWKTHPYHSFWQKIFRCQHVLATRSPRFVSYRQIYLEIYLYLLYLSLMREYYIIITKSKQYTACASVAETETLSDISSRQQLSDREKLFTVCVYWSSTFNRREGSIEVSVSRHLTYISLWADNLHCLKNHTSFS